MLIRIGGINPIQKSFCVETYLSTKSYKLTQRLDHIWASQLPDLNLLIFLFWGMGNTKMVGFEIVVFFPSIYP